MKKILVAFLALMLLLTGCGTGAAQAESDELRAEHKKLQKEFSALQAKYAELSEEYEGLKDYYEADGSEAEIDYWKTQYVAYSILYGAERTGLGEYYMENSIKTMAGVYDVDEESLRDCIDIILAMN